MLLKNKRKYDKILSTYKNGKNVIKSTYARTYPHCPQVFESKKPNFYSKIRTDVLLSFDENVKKWKKIIFLVDFFDVKKDC